MSKPRKDELLKTPQYRGGMAALKEFMAKHLKYPQEALVGKVEGVVEVAYDVDGLGKIRNVRIISGIGSGCDEEVIRLVNLLVYQKAVNKGKRTMAHKKLKVEFKLPKSFKKSSKQVTYHITKSKSPETKPEPKNAGYTIQVNFKKS